MNEPPVSEGQGVAGEASALFVQLIAQQANMAMMLLGFAPHPGTGKVTRDLEAAKLFIDQLEVLQQKTRGNLTRDEEQMLKQTMMSLQMAFVEAVERPSTPPAAPSENAAAAGTVASVGDASGINASSAEEESRKRFSKKY